MLLLQRQTFFLYFLLLNLLYYNHDKITRHHMDSLLHHDIQKAFISEIFVSPVNTPCPFSSRKPLFTPYSEYRFLLMLSFCSKNCLLFHIIFQIAHLNRSFHSVTNLPCAYNQVNVAVLKRLIKTIARLAFRNLRLGRATQAGAAAIALIGGLGRMGTSKSPTRRLFLLELTVTLRPLRRVVRAPKRSQENMTEIENGHEFLAQKFHQGSGAAATGALVGCAPAKETLAETGRRSRWRFRNQIYAQAYRARVRSGLLPERPCARRCVVRTTAGHFDDGPEFDRICQRRALVPARVYSSERLHSPCVAWASAKRGVRAYHLG